MKNKLLILKALLVLFFITSCSNDEENIATDFVVAFESASVSFDATDDKKNVKLVFSRPATVNGAIKIKFNGTNAVYGSGEDFTTSPEADSQGVITLNVRAGDSGASFEFNKLKTPLEGTVKSVDFIIANISLPRGRVQGNTTLAVSFTPSASLAGSFAPEIGGHNEPNQVFIDLSSETQKLIKRDTWSLAFYSGDDFRVKLNGAIFMGVAQLDATDINSVKEDDAIKELKPLIATGVAGSGGYFDDPSGDITKTAIAEVSATDDENKVYLLKLGFKVSEEAPEKVGRVKLSGDLIGWKKIRILRDGNNYKLLHANLNDTTYEEVVISKDDTYNFTFFSFDSNKTLQVEPEKNKWDLSFAPFTNVIPFGPGQTGAYGYSDYIVNNIHGGVVSYMVKDETEGAYKNFKLSNVDETKFTNDQRNIGSDWRSVFNGGSIKPNRFFILKDSDGNMYKLKFTALVNESGVRGYPKFEYKLL